MLKRAPSVTARRQRITARRALSLFIALSSASADEATIG